MERVSEASESDMRNAAAEGVVEEAGHFRIYLGAAAGVGKTYAMLTRATAGGTGVPTWSSGSSSATAGS